MEKKPLRRPEPHFVAHQDAPNLYEAEESLGDVVRGVGKELGKHLGLTEFYTEQLPQVLFDLFDNYDPEVGLIVAEAFLEHTFTNPRVATPEMIKQWADRGINMATRVLEELPQETDWDKIQADIDAGETPGRDT